MIWRCLDSLLVLAAFSAVYIIPPFHAVRRWMPSAGAAALLAVSAGLGLSSQALLGFVSNHLSRPCQTLEACLYFLFWLAVSLLLQWRKIPRSLPSIEPSIREKTLLALPLVLLVAIVLRNFDALGNASLGQSDAYTHLQFLRDVIRHGQIRNVVYPPGYSWVLALPVMTFNLDAYLVARYAGPFFGALMVVALYLLGRRHSQTAGLIAAFLAAACPFLYPLIKTGMGAFANQMGLFLLPLALYLYLVESPLVFTVILLGLTVSVPLLVFSLALILILYRIPSAWRGWSRETLSVVLPFLIALSLAGYQFLSPGKRHVATTATLVTGIQSPSVKKHKVAAQPPTLLKRIKANPAGKLVLDLLTVKRVGLGGLMNGAILALAVMFTGILLAGFRSGGAGPPRAVLRLVGGWGLLTTLQAATGFLEFSLYQRSGWILMEAIALAGGIIMASLPDAGRAGWALRVLAGVGLSACLLLALCVPPRHRCITSGAEHELATVLRELSAARIQALGVTAPLSFEAFAPSPLILRAAPAPGLAVITRRYTLFYADQGNMADVIPDPIAGIRQVPVDKDTRLVPPSDHFLCLVDRFSGLPDMGFFDRVSPDLVQSLAAFQPLLYRPNDMILAFLDALPRDTWRVTREERGGNLSVYFVERL